jgi:hypothetical protein
MAGQIRQIGIPINATNGVWKLGDRRGASVVSTARVGRNNRRRSRHQGRKCHRNFRRKGCDRNVPVQFTLIKTRSWVMMSIAVDGWGIRGYTRKAWRSDAYEQKSNQHCTNEGVIYRQPFSAALPIPHNQHLLAIS